MKIPDNVAELELHCMICTKVLPPDHARKKGSVTCPRNTESNCREVYTARRRAIVAMMRKKCRSCGAPYGPEEKALFKKWRREMQKTGQIRVAGRPPKKKPEGAMQVYFSPEFSKAVKGQFTKLIPPENKYDE